MDIHSLLGRLPLNELNSNSKRFSDLFIVGNGNFLSGGF